MHASDAADTRTVELSRAEQWVVHHVLLDAIGLADGEVDGAADEPSEDEPTLSAIRTLESGTFRFSPPELAAIREACGDHARTTEAAADRNLASAVADRIDPLVAEATAGDTYPPGQTRS